MAYLVMRKRPAMHAGELGLFIDSQVFEDEFANIHQGTDITIEATQSRNPKQFRLFWALAGKIAKSGVLGDSDNRDVVDYLLMKCKHVKYITTEFRSGITETIPVPKSIRFASMDQTAFNRLFNRALYVVTSEILPHVPDTELRDEIMKMAGVDTPEPEQKKRRGRPSLPKPVSIIPDTDPVTAGVPSNGSRALKEPPLDAHATNSDPAAEPVTEPDAEIQHPLHPAQPAPSDPAHAGRAALRGKTR